MTRPEQSTAVRPAGRPEPGRAAAHPEPNADAARPSTSGPSSTRSVERALGLLAHVCESAPTSLSECARAVGLSPTTALRLLRTLEVLDFVSRDPGGDFHPGALSFRFGAAALGRNQMIKAAEPALQRLCARCGESTYLAITSGPDRAVYIAMAEGTYSIRHAGWVGRTVPLETTAIGAVLQGRTPEWGYVVVRSSVEEDVTAIAAPITWIGGVAGALNVVGPSYRLDPERSRDVGKAVAAEARTIARTLFPTHDTSEVTSR
ncbi:IclR family transcriptional regulator [Monashia sp. NPDC004114]